MQVEISLFFHLCCSYVKFSFQDAFLPHVEDGTIVLLGATTENPSFHINNALLSRCQVVVLEKLGMDNIRSILCRALKELNVEVVSDEFVEDQGER